MKRLLQNNFLYAVALFAVVLFFGIGADINFYEFKVNGKTETNYEFGNKDSMGYLQVEYSANFPYKTNFVDLNGFVRRIVGQREMNDVIKLNNGYLTQVGSKMDDESISNNAQAIVDFNDYCVAHGTRLLYVQPAYKISKYDEQLPIGVTDGHNETIDKLLSLLSKADVPIIDLREMMYNDGIDQYQLYFRTDHHWTNQGAFYAYKKIALEIAKETNTELDANLLNIKNYRVDKYPGWHLGMRGQRTGAAFAGIDDFDLIYPGFETHIRQRSTGAVAALEDVLISKEVFNNHDVHNRYTYDSAYSAIDINDLESLDAKSNLNVWLLSDSFQHGIKPYLLLTYKEFHVASYSTLSTSFIQNKKPDIVIIMPWPGYFNQGETCFNYIDDESKT